MYALRDSKGRLLKGRSLFSAVSKYVDVYYSSSIRFSIERIDFPDVVVAVYRVTRLSPIKLRFRIMSRPARVFMPLDPVHYRYSNRWKRGK